MVHGQLRFNWEPKRLRDGRCALREQEELDKIRPELDGTEIMSLLGLKQGPLVGKAWNFLLELRLEEGELGRERVTAELLRWAARHGIRPPT